MLELLSPYFPTLLSKTIFILILSFASTCIGMVSIYLHARTLPQNSDHVVKRNYKGASPLKNSSLPLGVLFWGVLTVNIISVLLLLFIQGSSGLSLGLLFLFTFTEGILLGIIVLPVAFLAIFALLFTIIITAITGAVGYLTGIDFEFLGGFLFIGLLILMVIGIFRIFKKAEGLKAKLIPIFGILIFAGYIVYDFYNLKKLNGIDKFNNWETAIQSATNLYLDVINLFLYILDLMSELSK